MCVYSKFWLQWEKKNLAPYAVHSDHVWYSKRSPDDSLKEALDMHGSRSRYRTAFEIDKDRITNSQAFRRLEYKTQVFVTHEGDNFRTRLTHTLEVAEIARHIARALRLNEHLVEAIALGHDLGHAPYGHVAEETINSWIKNLKPPLKGNYYFCHNRQSIEIVEHLEPGYDWDARDKIKDFGQGLNLTTGVREGILVHISAGYRGLVHTRAKFDHKFESLIRELSIANKNKGLFFPGSLEAQVVRISDDLAQRIHDLEDGFRSNMLNKQHIRTTLKKFLEDLKKEIFNLKKITRGRYLTHKEYGTKVSKAFLADIVDMTALKNNDRDTIGKKIYEEIQEEDIDKINNMLKDNSYQEKFLLAAQVAFLLHMWRDDDYLDRLSDEEQEKSRTRILKYLKLLIEIIKGQDGGEKYPPTYHIIAFLRGIMLANVIEHSFWNIHRRTDPDFRKIKETTISEEIKELKKSNLEGKTKWYLIFVLVDGLTIDHRNKVSFDPQKNQDIRYCFEFEEEKEMNEFIEIYFGKILATNGSHLKSKEFKDKYKLLSNVRWLNKSEEPHLTEYVKIKYKDKKQETLVPVEKVRIYFTGYKDLCPGVESGPCDYVSQFNKKRCFSSKECPFWSENLKYPDINRLVEFQDSMAELDSRIKKLISERIHSGSRVARMNYMGKKIICELLDIYLHNPRLMHDRVWSWLRIFPNMKKVSHPVREWIECPIDEKEKRILPEEALSRLTDKDDPNFECNRYSLIRRIIEHISGMTDRFIANEYNRVNQSGREVELQDEAYFFS